MTENFRKSRRASAGLRFLYMVVVVLLIAGIVCVWLYFKSGPVRRLEAENESLRGEIVKLESHNEQLHEEILQNLHYKDLIEPIQTKAKQLYPELGSNAAIAMLIEDLKTDRKPATRDRQPPPPPPNMYKPPSPDVIQRITSELEGIIANYRGAGPKVKIIFDAGNLNRLKVAESVYGLFKQAGYRVGGEMAIAFSRHNPGVSILYNPDDSEAAYRIGTAIYGYIKNQYSGVEEMERLRATYEIIIAGDPLISEDGTVTLR